MNRYELHFAPKVRTDSGFVISIKNWIQRLWLRHFCDGSVRGVFEGTDSRLGDIQTLLPRRNQWFYSGSGLTKHPISKERLDVLFFGWNGREETSFPRPMHRTKCNYPNFDILGIFQRVILLTMQNEEDIRNQHKKWPKETFISARWETVEDHIIILDHASSVAHYSSHRK